MKKIAPISSIMTSNVVAVERSDSLEDAEKLMIRHHIRHVPVVTDGELVGMLSLTDLKRMSFVDMFGDSESEVDTAIYNMMTIEQVMIARPLSVAPNTTIKEVAEIFAEREFHALPVTEDGKLVGIVTTTDLIRYLLDQL
jgi:predicted transcriptional regulator